MEELSYKELKSNCDIKLIEKYFNIQPDENIIGQKNAIESLCFGLNIENDGYNIYVSGASGVGKSTYTKKYTEKIAKTKDVPDDLVYVYNFKNHKEPKAIFFKAGLGKEFKKDIDDFIHLINTNIFKLFSSDDFQNEKDEIFKTYNIKKDEILQQVKAIANKKGFGIKNSTNGIYFMPIVDDFIMPDDEFDALPESEKDEINKKIEALQEEVSPTIKIIKDIERDTKKELENKQYNFLILFIGRYIAPIQNKYIHNEKALEYLKDLKEDLLENLLYNINLDEEDNISIFSKKCEEDIFEKYGVNLIIDNSALEGAPVVIDYNPSYTNLVGEVEFENELGNLTSDYMKIKSGILHKANGGYLILNIDDVLKNTFCFETLLRTLKTKKLNIEPLKEHQLGMVSINSIRPEPIDINFKLILIGSSYYYDILSDYEEDFNKYFKVHSIFDYEIDKNEQNIKDAIKFIKGFEKKEKTLPFDKTAIKEIIEYNSRLSGKQDKLTTKFGLIHDILFEANVWAKMDNASEICSKYIQKAIYKKRKFSNLYEKKYEEMILSEEILIDTKGKKIGAINGLSVLDYNDVCFGKPIKITATSYIGKAGLINIEKEAKMSGSLYDKGVEIISGYIGHMYGKLFPLNLSCRICFEQNYSGIDGDSASSAELLAVISSLSGVPIKQNIAITGSVNQFGDIQPIGGVNEKIEGFFDICKKRELTGNQGVVIPKQNVKDLSLRKDVISAVKEGLFHIYSISSIDEAIYILLGEKAGKKIKEGIYTKDSVHYKVMKKLKNFYIKTKE